MNRSALAALLLAISIALTVWLIVSSFVTYAPMVTASQMQNIYLGSIFWLGGPAVFLQVAVLFLVLSGRISRS